MVSICRSVIAHTFTANFYKDCAMKQNLKGNVIAQQKSVVSYRKRLAGSDDGE